MQAIQTHGLHKQFGPTLAVADLSLSVQRGEVFGFLGPNGAGKTTSIKLLLGLVQPDGGSGTVLGAPLGDCKVRSRIGFLPEHFRFHECLTSRELLRLHGRLYGLRGANLEKRIDELLERVHLTDARNRMVREYSKGMLQRVGLAQAVLNEPELVFLDEPTSGLDPLGRILVRELIEELRAKGAAVFLNSHLLGEIEAICSRVAFVKNGHTVRELCLSQASAAMQVELRVDRIDAAVLEGLSRFGDGIAATGTTVRLRVPDENILPDLARWLVDSGLKLYGMTPRRKSLEEWFVDIMGADQRPG